MIPDRSSRSLARLQVILMLGVVASFLGANAAATLSARSIDQNAQQIARDELPSIRNLSMARAELHELDTYFQRSGARGGTVSPDHIRDHVQRMHDALDAYHALGTDKLHDWMMLELAEDELDAGISSVLAASAPHEVKKSLITESRAADSLDDLLQQFIELEGQQGAKLARELEQTHTRSTYIGVVLDGVSMLLAVCATAIAIVMQRRTVRGLEHDKYTATERASELDMFSARVAHDLVSPLMTASLALELARADAGQERTRNAIDRGLRSIGRVKLLVDDLLGFARAGAKPADLHATANVAEVVTTVVENAQVRADAKHVRLSVDVPRSCSVQCSTGVLHSILSNLVNNAIHHMDREEGRVEVRATPGPSITHVEITDTGPGIPEAIRDSLFEPFVRGGTGEGLGLGLATAKRLVDAHGGTINYRTSKAGTTFCVDLPA